MRLVRFLLLSLTLLVLGTTMASAHEGISHEQPSAEASFAAVGSEAPSLSRSCPGIPGKFCCCGTLHAVPGKGKLPLADAVGYFSANTTADRVRVISFVSATPSARLPSAARPRAPPLFS